VKVVAMSNRANDPAEQRAAKIRSSNLKLGLALAVLALLFFFGFFFKTVVYG
jgi:hypothetical protein